MARRKSVKIRVISHQALAFRAATAVVAEMVMIKSVKYSEELWQKLDGFYDKVLKFITNLEIKVLKILMPWICEETFRTHTIT